MLVEAASQFYRCFIPVQPWAAYLLNNYEGYDKIFGTVLVVAYILWAFRDVVLAGKFLRESYIKFKQNSVRNYEISLCLRNKFNILLSRTLAPLQPEKS